MTKKDELYEVNPSEDTKCPEHTKKYLLARGYKPHRKPSGKITWVNHSNRVYKSIRKHHKSLFFYYDRFGTKRLKKSYKALIYTLITGLMIYMLLAGIVKLPF